MAAEDDKGSSSAREAPPPEPASVGPGTGIAQVGEHCRELLRELRAPALRILDRCEAGRQLDQDRSPQTRGPFVLEVTAEARRLVELVDALTEALEADVAAAARPPSRQGGAEWERVVTSETVVAPNAAQRASDVFFAPERVEGSAPAPATQTRAAGSRGCLLVVDDSELNRLVMTQELEQRGYAVHTAAGGHEALAATERHRFDLVLLDVMMPDLSGLEVLQTLRQQHEPAALPIIMATARDASEDVVRALGLGANDYVTKPIDFAVAAARIETHLTVKRSKDALEALNRRLGRAQERIAELAESAADGTQDLTTWSQATAKQVAEAIGAHSIRVIVFDSDGRPPAAPNDPPALSEDLQYMAESGKAVSRSGYALIPVSGPTKRLYGALVVRGPSAGWSAPERRLVESFAHQLGGVLELRRMQEQLDRAAEQRRLVQREMLDRGIDLLRLCPECGRCYDQRAESCEADQAALSEPRSFPFRIAGRYRLVKVRGQGGMGTVYQAFDERLDRDVAVKVIRSEHFQSESLRNRFEAEARAVARIDHPGVVAVYDSGDVDDGSQFIVMEWLPGRDLAEIMRLRGRGTPAQVALLLRQGGAALAAARDADLVHRDIKPANIFLTPDPTEGFRVKLLDFGVAKHIAAEAGVTQTGAIVGTPQYMAPEQLLSFPVDARGDLYSFAAVVFQALTGRRVVESDEFGAAVVEVVNGTPPPVSSFVPAVPAEVDTLMRAALAKDPADRPDCVHQWATDLADHLDRLPSGRDGWQPPDGELPR